MGGALGTDTSVDGQVEPNLKQPEEPSASPRMDTEPSARDHSPRQGDQQAPRSEDNLNRPDVQSPRSTPEYTGHAVAAAGWQPAQYQPDTQPSPRTKLLLVLVGYLDGIAATGGETRRPSVAASVRLSARPFD